MTKVKKLKALFDSSGSVFRMYAEPESGLAVANTSACFEYLGIPYRRLDSNGYITPVANS